MELISVCEFRGKSSRKDDKGNWYFYINLEDENGESSKFQTLKELDLKDLKKGDKVTVKFDLNIKFGSLKVSEVTKNGKV